MFVNFQTSYTCNSKLEDSSSKAPNGHNAHMYYDCNHLIRLRLILLHSLNVAQFHRNSSKFIKKHTQHPVDATLNVMNRDVVIKFRFKTNYTYILSLIDWNEIRRYFFEIDTLSAVHRQPSWCTECCPRILNNTIVIRAC